MVALICDWPSLDLHGILWYPRVTRFVLGYNRLDQNRCSTKPHFFRIQSFERRLFGKVIKLKLYQDRWVSQPLRKNADLPSSHREKQLFTFSGKILTKSPTRRSAKGWDSSEIQLFSNDKTTRKTLEK